MNYSPNDFNGGIIETVIGFIVELAFLILMLGLFGYFAIEVVLWIVRNFL